MLRSVIGATLMVALIAARVGAQLTLLPDLTLSGDRLDLSSISWVDAFANGTIAVGLPQDHQIRFFSPSGRPVGSFGRQGSGPNEFVTLAWLHGFVGDTLWTWDASLDRYTLLDHRGRAVRLLPRPRPLGLLGFGALPLGGAVSIQGFDQSGRLLINANASANAHLPSPWQDKLQGNLSLYFWAGATGSVGDLVAALPTAFAVCGDDLATQKECARPMAAVASDAAMVVSITSQVTGREGGLLRAVGFGPNGDTLFNRVHRFARIPIPKRESDSLRSAMVNGARSGAGRDYWRRAVLPEFRRPVTRVMVGKDLSTWIGFHSSDRGREWLILDRTGKEIGRILTEPGIELTAASDRFVWGYQADADGLESVVRFRISRQ